jgi:putative aldouronate transport system permease protein
MDNIDSSPKSILSAKKLSKNNRSLLQRYIKCRYFFFMLIPVIIYFGVFHYGPLYGIVIAFKDFFPLRGVMGSPWVGFKHFNEIFTGMFFGQVLKNTILISTYKLIFGFPAPIILAVLINEVRHLWFKKTIQTITYLPHFISWIVLAGMFIEFLSPTRGPINIILQDFGLDPIFFLGEPKLFRSVLVVTSIWKGVGWGTIIYLAAMAGVDPELYDVADIDGAGRVKKILQITLPSIMPVIIIMLIFSAGSIINDDFDQIYNLLNNSVLSSGDVISTYVYREGLTKMNYSYATAVGLFKNIVAFGLVLLTNFIARRTSEYAIW